MRSCAKWLVMTMKSCKETFDLRLISKIIKSLVASVPLTESFQYKLYHHPHGLAKNRMILTFAFKCWLISCFLAQICIFHDTMNINDDIKDELFNSD